MAFNQIQFQHGMSIPEFLRSFGTEAQCAEAIKAARWPEGFRCPRCASSDHYVVGHGARKLFQCNGCRHQTGNLRSLNGRQLAWDRLEDLRTLAALRGGVAEGERMQHLFWRLNFLLLSGATHTGQMYHEAAALARELDPRWNYRSFWLIGSKSKRPSCSDGRTNLIISSPSARAAVELLGKLSFNALGKLRRNERSE